MVQVLLKRVWQFLKKIKYNVYNWANPLSIYRREMKTGTQMNTYSRIFIAALFTIAEQWKQPIKGWMDRQIITMECYSVRKINEVLIHASTWMNPENMPLKEVSNKTPNTVWLHLCEIYGTGKIHGDRADWCLSAGGWGVTDWWVSFWVRKMF